MPKLFGYFRLWLLPLDWLMSSRCQCFAVPNPNIDRLHLLSECLEQRVQDDDGNDVQRVFFLQRLHWVVRVELAMLLL
jgi:hypothetical protein